MKEILLSFRHYSEANFTKFLTEMLGLVNANPIYEPLRSEINLVQEKFEVYNVASVNAYKSGSFKTEIKNNALKALKEAVVLFAKKLEVHFNFQADPILHAGFTIRRDNKRRIQSIQIPENVIASNAKAEGAVDVKWNSVVGATGYNIEHQIVDETNWQDSVYASRRQVQLKGLKGGTRIRIRVRALGTNDLYSDWSQPTEIWVS